MNLVQKFVESEAQRVFHDYRKRFDEWLDEVDIDGNGQTDKQQILADFDRMRDGAMDIIAGASDLSRLAREYYTKYGKDITGTTGDTTAKKK